MGTVFAINRMIPCRRKLAPADWIPCPECHERGLWMEDGRQHWCPRCYGTGILLVAELTDPAEIALCHRVSDHAKKGKKPPGRP